MSQHSAARKEKVESIKCQRNTLLDELLFILGGVKDGKIKSKPILDTSDKNAASWPMISLEEHIIAALAKCGLKVVEK